MISLLVFTMPVAAGNGADVVHDSWNNPSHFSHTYWWGTWTWDIIDKGVSTTVMTPSGNYKVNAKGVFEYTETFEYIGGGTDTYSWSVNYKDSLLLKDGEEHLVKTRGEYWDSMSPYGTYWETWSYQFVNGKIVKNLSDWGFIPAPDDGI